LGSVWRLAFPLISLSMVQNLIAFFLFLCFGSLKIIHWGGNQLPL
jgi:hypothetical protein